MPEHDETAPDFKPLEAELGAIHAGDAAIIQTAQEAVAPKELNVTELYAVRGEDGALEVLDLERYRVQPDRARCTVRPGTVDALSAYVKRHGIEGHTSVWVAPDAGRIIAVIDEHGADAVAEARFRQHRAELELLVTPEWEFWLKRDGELMDQQAFAEHIEEGLDDIREPDGATMLEVAQSIHGTNKATFRSGYKLENGELKFGYDEDVNIRAGDPQKHGELAIPHELKLAVAPFIGEPAFELHRHRCLIRVATGEVALAVGEEHRALLVDRRFRLHLVGDEDGRLPLAGRVDLQRQRQRARLVEVDDGLRDVRELVGELGVQAALPLFLQDRGEWPALGPLGRLAVARLLGRIGNGGRLRHREGSFVVVV
jgi:uncharacterized protein YfdQ (DUF2303 family)